MPRYAFEDFEPGDSRTYGDVTVDRGEIVAFARQYDPQPFHLGDEEAEGTFVGELIASGWHSLGLQMRMLCDAVLVDSTALGAPGVEEVKWLAPVRPGDRLHVVQTVLDTKGSTSRPEIGLVRVRLDLRDGTGATKMQQTNWLIFARRAAAGQVRPAPARFPAPRGSSRSGSSDDPSRPVFTRFADDLAPGLNADLGRHTFTAEDIVAFARRFDPQPFHLDAEAAKNSLFGALCASGWQTGAVWCKLFTATRDAAVDEGRGRGEPVPRYGSSPGLRDLKWLKPVFAGDTIRYRLEIVEARASRSRPGWGLVVHDNTGENQHGERVFSMRSTSFWSLSTAPA